MIDKVGHKRLVEKMKYYGVQGTNTWIESFLADRKQVVLDGQRYETGVAFGVPQGSVLGPGYNKTMLDATIVYSCSQQLLLDFMFNLSN